MEFLNFNNKKHKYQDLFKTYSEEEFTHYHCDICETPHKSKVAALNCCSDKKVKFIEILKKNKIKPNRLFKNIEKLDDMFQQVEFGRDKSSFLSGSEYNPFYNLFYEELQEWDVQYDLFDIIRMGIYKPRRCYQFYSWHMHEKALEIKYAEQKEIIKRLSKKKKEVDNVKN